MNPKSTSRNSTRSLVSALMALLALASCQSADVTSSDDSTVASHTHSEYLEKTGGEITGTLGIGGTATTPLHVEGTSAASLQMVRVEDTQANASAFLRTGVGVFPTISRTSNGTTYYRSYNTSLENLEISSGVTDSGYQWGYYADAVRADADDEGTLAKLGGAKLYYGHNSTVDSGATTNFAEGLEIQGNFAVGTIGTAHDLYLKSPASTAGTVTNRWSIYQEDATTRNYFASKVGVGVADPKVELDVNGLVKLTPQASAPFTCDATYDGAIALTTSYQLCVCNGGGGAWVLASDGATTCGGSW